jgi:hypothetical protein
MFTAEFMLEYDSAELPPEVISKVSFGHLGRFLYNIIFMAWTRLVCGHTKPPVEFLVDCLVSKHARPVIYYVTGWTLYRASKALTIAKDKRPVFHQFADVHSIDKDSSKSMSLPTSLIDRWKHNLLSVYCSHDYFVFICFVKSVYLANLSLKMMMAYADGDIIA